MSASDLKPGTTDQTFLPPSQEATTALDVTACHKDELEPQALELLTEFFLLLDQWEREKGH